MNTWLFIKVVKQTNEDETMYKERVNLYKLAVEKHNLMIQENYYYDSGFDLYQPHLPEAMAYLICKHINWDWGYNCDVFNS